MLTPEPLLIADLLTAVGVPGSIALLAVAVVALYHFQEITQALSKLGFAAKIVAAVGVLLLAALLGLIPGVSLSVAVSVLAGWLGTVLELVGAGIGAVLEALGMVVVSGVVA